MFFRLTAFLLLVAVGQGFGQKFTSLNLGTQAQNPDFSNFPFTRPISVGSALPSTCQVGQMFFNSAAIPGQNIYGCTQPNTWAQFGTLPIADSTTLGGVSIGVNSGLQVAAGALSVTYGTIANSALQGKTLGQPNGPASLDATGKIPSAQLGNLGSAAFLSSTAFDAVGAAAAAVSAIPQSGSGVTRAALITPADWLTFNSKQSPLGFTPENFLNKNAKNGYAGLDANGLFPWAQISGVLTANHLQAGILSASDWNAFNSKQGALGFTPENPANKGLAGGYAALNTIGQVPLTQLPVIATKTSQLTNDASFVNSAQAASAAPVQSVNGLTGAVSLSIPTKVSQVSNDSGYVTASTSPVTSVNGQTGAITVPSGNYQQVAVNSSVQTQALAMNLKAGANVTLSGTYNSGTQSTDVTISASSGSGGSVTSGAALPSQSSCSATAVGAFYEQTGANQHLFTCQNKSSTYSWIPIDSRQVNVMGFGCKADGSSDDQPCFQAAVNAASFLNLYGSTYYGSEVFVPCGKYALGSPIVIPRGGGGGSFSYGTGNAVVSIRGENKACSQLQGLSSFTKGITGIAITNVGSGYTSAPTITLSGGGASTQGTVISSIFGGALNTAFLSTAGSGYTSMPTCVVTGGGGTGAACMAVGHAMIETGRTAVRLVGMSLQDLTFSEPAVQGTMAFHHWMVNAENTSGGTSGGGPVTERIERGVFRNLVFSGDNGNTPADIYIAGDCEACIVDNITSDASRGTSDNYETVAVMTDVCVNGAMANESCGLQIGSISNITAGATRGGFVASFQGRFMREDFRSSFSNGLHGGLANSICYLFVNSIDSVITNVANEGNGETAQIELVNSRSNYFSQWGLGVPNSQGAGTGNGLVLVNSSDNVFDTNEPSSIFGSSFVAGGGHAILADASSHANRFLNTQLAVATDYSISDLNTNFIQYCNASGGDTACLAGTFLTDGVMPGYVSSVAVPASSSSSCTKGQTAQSQQYTYYCFANNSWVRAPMSSF